MKKDITVCLKTSRITPANLNYPQLSPTIPSKPKQTSTIPRIPLDVPEDNKKTYPRFKLDFLQHRQLPYFDLKILFWSKHALFEIDARLILEY